MFQCFSAHLKSKQPFRLTPSVHRIRSHLHLYQLRLLISHGELKHLSHLCGVDFFFILPLPLLLSTMFLPGIILNIWLSSIIILLILEPFIMNNIVQFDLNKTIEAGAALRLIFIPIVFHSFWSTILKNNPNTKARHRSRCKYISLSGTRQAVWLTMHIQSIHCWDSRHSGLLIDNKKPDSLCMCGLLPTEC